LTSLRATVIEVDLPPIGKFPYFRYSQIEHNRPHKRQQGVFL
jgi:hypothetical protein